MSTTKHKSSITKKKVCIYLDQFAVSDLLNPITGSHWPELKRLILEKREENKIFCPLSHEHYLETSQKVKAQAQEHDIFLTTLSDGFAFKPELFITAQLISSRLRKNNTTVKTFMYDNVKDILKKDENYYLFEKLAKEQKNLLIDATASVNAIRVHTRSQKLKAKDKHSFIKASKYLQTQGFITRLEELLKKEKIFIRGEKIGEKEVPNWIDLIVEQLLKKHKLTRKEIKRLHAEIKSIGFDGIPTLDIRTTLIAYIGLYSKREDPADHIDIMRISSGMLFSDIMLVDRQRKAELVESGLAKKYKTEIYTGRKDDLKKLIEKLETL